MATPLNNRETGSEIGPTSVGTALPPWALSLISLMAYLVIIICVVTALNAFGAVSCTRRRRSSISQRSSASWHASYPWDILQFSSPHKEKLTPPTHGLRPSEVVDISTVHLPPPAYIPPPDYRDLMLPDIEKGLGYGSNWRDKQFLMRSNPSQPTAFCPVGDQPFTLTPTYGSSNGPQPTHDYRI